MNNKKSTKRALLSSVLSLVLCVTMLIGTTFAWFTDSVTSSNNRIQAGNLKVDLLMDKEEKGTYVSIADKENDTTEEGDIFSEATGNGILWEPGKTEIVYLAVQNLGSLDLKYNILLNITDGGLVGSLEYAVLDGKKATDLSNVKDWATLKAMAQTGDIVAGRMLAAPNGALEAGENSIDYFALAVHMKEEAGNDYQGKDVTIDVALEATQLASESDSFGNTYDKLATFKNGAFTIKPTEGIAEVAEDNTFSYESEDGTVKASGTKAGDAEEVAVYVTPVTTNDEVIEEDGDTGRTYASYDVKVVGYEKGTVVTVELFAGKGLSEVRVYHEGELMKTADYDYDSLTGVVTIRTTSFSEYTISFATSGVLPLANVTVLTEMPTVTPATGDGKPVTLNTAYLFETVETYEEAQESPYAKWHADFVVTFNKEVKEGTAGLAGQYDTYSKDWLAFHIPDVDENDGFKGVKANTPVRLLDFAGICMNYEELCLLVERFQCGAFDVDGANEGTTMTVELRLFETVPQSESENNSANNETSNYKVIGVYNYTF